jgi:hypothetical protein
MGFNVEWAEESPLTIESLDDVQELVARKHREFLESGTPTLVEVFVPNEYGLTIGLGSSLGSVLMFMELGKPGKHWITDGGGSQESFMWWRYSNQASELPTCTLIPTDQAIEGLIDSLRLRRPSNLVPWE